MLSIFWGVSVGKKRSIYILSPCREIGLSFEKSLRGGKPVKNFEIFWTSNKTIIEFGFRVMWRVMQWSWRLLPTLVFSSVDNSLLDLLNSSHHTQPHSIQSNPALRTAAYHGQFPLCLGKAVTFSLNPTHLIRIPVHEDNGRLFLAQSTDSHRQSTRANEDPSLSTVCWYDLYINKSSQFSSSRHMDTLVLQR